MEPLKGPMTRKIAPSSSRPRTTTMKLGDYKKSSASSMKLGDYKKSSMKLGDLKKKKSSLGVAWG